MIARTRRRVEAIEERFTARIHARRDAVTEAWLKGMSIDDLELMATIAGRREDGEPEAAILESLTPAERARLEELSIDHERIRSEHDTGT